MIRSIVPAVELAAAVAIGLAAASQVDAREQSDGSAPARESQASGTAKEKEASARPTGILPIPDYQGDVWDRPLLTGDWGGTRTELADKGIQINVDWCQTFQSIVSGGLDTGSAYGGSLDYLVNFDLDRMGVLPGALVKIRAETRYGQSVNNIAGPLLAVNTDAFFPLSSDDIPITVTDLAYYQFLSEHFGVFLGKFDTLDGDPNAFASGRGNTQFMNSAFVYNPVVALTVPYSTLGAGILVMPTKGITISSTIMNTQDASTTTGFGDFGDGWTWSTEADFQYALGKLPGGQNLGVIWAGDRTLLDFNGRFTFQPGVGLQPPTTDNTWAVYWSGWQYLHTGGEVKSPINLDEGAPDVQGFGLFARAGIADGSTNPIEWSVSGGLGGQGLIPGRERDRFGVGYSYSSVRSGRLTNAVGFRDNTQAFETFYDFAITPAAQLTFDLQVVRGPQPAADTGVILGLRLFMNF